MIHSLGIHFGVSEWQHDFKTKFEFSESFDLEEEDEIETATVKKVKVKELEKNEADQVEKFYKFYNEIFHVSALKIHTESYNKGTAFTDANFQKMWILVALDHHDGISDVRIVGVC